MKILLSPRDSEDQQRIRAACEKAGVEMFVVPWRLDDQTKALIESEDVCAAYCEAMFADVLASQVSLYLQEAPLTWLVACPVEFTGRKIQMMTAGEARTMPGPIFIKHEDNKSLTPRVYTHGSEISDLVDDAETVMTSVPINWHKEARLFVLDGKIQTASTYIEHYKPHQRLLDTDEAHACQSLIDKLYAQMKDTMPRATVIDLGQLESGEWTVIELNAAWGSGLYACDENLALPVIIAATCDPDAPQKFLRDKLSVEW